MRISDNIKTIYDVITSKPQSEKQHFCKLTHMEQVLLVFFVIQQTNKYVDEGHVLSAEALTASMLWSEAETLVK